MPPFKISDKCCDIMKKNPFKEYEKKTGNKGIIGVMAVESSKRVQDYLKFGCNSFDSKRPISRPLGFWIENDILEYLSKFNIPYASVYGLIIGEKNNLQLTGLDRTGCMFCMYGVHMGEGLNRFQRMKNTHPKIYNYCINELGLGVCLDYINVKY